MHKEIVGTLGRAEKIVFDAEDIPFFRGDYGYKSIVDLAKHFGVSENTIYKAIRRQPELFNAYEEHKEKQKNMHKETVSGYKYKVEKNVFDAEDIEKVEKLAASHTLDQIAEYFGIGKTTFKDIRKRQLDVDVSYKMGKAKEIETFYDHLKEKALGITDKGDNACLIFFLKTKGGWSEAVPETKIEDEIVLTPEQQEEKEKDVKLFTEFKKWKKEKGIE